MMERRPREGTDRGSAGPSARTLPARIRTGAAILMLVPLLLCSCESQDPLDDREYLVWEVCHQVRTEGMTAGRVSGILHDASRHGPVMDDIEAECGDEIASVYSE